MSRREIKLIPGSVYIDLEHEYEFRGKRKGEKYLVVLGEYNNVYLTAITTSQKFDGRRNVVGCHLTPYPYFFVNKIDGVFTKGTWIILDRTNKVLRIIINDKREKIVLKKPLPEQVIKNIVTCFKRSPDITDAERKYLKWH